RGGLEMREGLVLVRSQASSFLNLHENAAPASTVTSKPLDFRPVAQAVVPGTGSGHHDVVALRKIVLARLPQEPAGALGDLRDACDRHRRSRRRDRGLSGVPQPSRPLLLLRMGSVGPVVS